MAGTFPIDHDGIQTDIKVSAVSAVTIGTSESGIEARTIWNTNIRWRYSVSIIARSEVAGELANLATLITQNYVDGDTMDITHEITGAQTVRFEGSPSFTQWRIPGWYRFECNLISLV